MNREFKFPVSVPTPESAPLPPVPTTRDSNTAPASPPPIDRNRAGREDEELTGVGMVAPSSVDVHPPTPLEKEKAGNVADDVEEDVGPTEEISLN